MVLLPVFAALSQSGVRLFVVTALGRDPGDSRKKAIAACRNENHVAPFSPFVYYGALSLFTGYAMGLLVDSFFVSSFPVVFPDNIIQREESFYICPFFYI